MNKTIDVYKYLNALRNVHTILGKRGFENIVTHGFTLDTLPALLNLFIYNGWTMFVKKNDMWKQCFFTAVRDKTLAVVYMFTQDINFDPVKYDSFVKFIVKHSNACASKLKNICEIEIMILCYRSTTTNTPATLKSIKSTNNISITFQVLSVTRFLQIDVLSHVHNDIHVASDKDIQLLCKKFNKTKKEMCAALPKIRPSDCISVALNLHEMDIVYHVRSFDTGNSSIEFRVVST